MELIQTLGGTLCRMTLSSARCYDPGSTLGIGLAVISIIVALLLGAYFTSGR
jgi:hypothetical protein